MDDDTLNSDKRMVAAVLSGDQAAFIDLVHQYQGMVSHLIFRLIANSTDREEVCQDVFLKVHKNLHSFRFQSKLSTWISRISYNTAINYLNKHQLETVEYEVERVSEDRGPADEMNAVQLKSFVHQKLNLLTVVERSVLTLYHLEEMTVPEISQVMMRPEGTIKSDLFRARKKLRDMIATEERQ
jgi:RNA polymerase sigma-70 factor (ECF subfamily)